MTTEASTSTEQSGSNWVAPSTGAPCWFELPCTDLSRGSKFYSTVFNWTLKGEPIVDKSDDGEPDTMQMFDFPKAETKSFTGGGMALVKKTASADAKIDPHGAPVVYLWCTDVDETLEKVLKAGGKTVTPKVPQGDSGFYARFVDTEGNVLGIYALKK